MAKRRGGLGRGLGALIPMEEEEIQEDVPMKGVAKDIADGDKKPSRGGKLAAGAGKDQDEDDEAIKLPIDLVEPNPNQPRKHFEEEQLQELSESIKAYGLLQPVLVRKVGKKYQIIAGERRWQASKRAGLKEIPVRVAQADDNRSLTLAMIENIQRSNLNPMEEAYGYRALMDAGNMTQAQLAAAVSKGRSTIANSLRLLDLPESAQKLLLDGVITAGHARAILSIPTSEGRERLTRKLAEEKLSVREAERLAHLFSAQKKEPTARPKRPASYKRVERELHDVLGVDVRVSSAGGKNKIEIKFADEDELERLFKKLVSEE